MKGNEVPRTVLLRAVKIIKQWHDMDNYNPDDNVFQIYYEHSPEMKMIRNTLGSYDEMKDEIIESISISVNET